ncbi:hypothetical protein [Variovorax guangxiensis]|uniref:hypothetical protein n=1 Tax=Variovorax guangxiensis TaxID=1775474 RepID=UPI0028586F7F|nr:hypothetical protein [Variovorax guangxiensis]MDR6860546.1 hypothetical protein [Variovorax guangxiensis]
MTSEPRTIARIRKSPSSPTERLLLAHIDTLVDQLERYEGLELTDEQILAVAGPPTDSLGGKDVWMLGTRDLTRLARQFLAAAMQARSGG